MSARPETKPLRFVLYDFLDKLLPQPARLKPQEGDRVWYPMLVGCSSVIETIIIEEASISTDVSQTWPWREGGEEGRGE